MKTSVILFGLIFAHRAVDATKILLYQMLANGFLDCYLHMGPSAEVKGFIMKNLLARPDHREANCIRACAMSNAGFMDDGKVDISKVLAIIRLEKYGTPEELKLWSTMLENCKKTSEVSEDRCTVAGNYVKCYISLSKDKHEDATTIAPFGDDVTNITANPSIAAFIN